jgi:hypothetical protein
LAMFMAAFLSTNMAEASR